MPQLWPPQRQRALAGRVPAASSAGATAVAFPSGFFTAPPMVTATTRGGAFAYLVADATVTGFGVATNSAVATPVDWIAVQN